MGARQSFIIPGVLPRHVLKTKPLQRCQQWEITCDCCCSETKGGGGGHTHTTHRHARTNTDLWRRRARRHRVAKKCLPGPRIPPHLSFLLYFIFILFIFYFVCMYECLHAHMCTMSMPWRPEETSDLLELELQAVGGLLMYRMPGTQVLCKSS